jgi:hypothetical protein
MKENEECLTQKNKTSVNAFPQIVKKLNATCNSIQV